MRAGYGKRRAAEIGQLTCYLARLMAEDSPDLGAGTAIAAFAGLIVGMLAIGAPAQQRGVVAGLWITEALAIALPAIFVLSAAGLRFAPYLGLRPLSLRQALLAAAVAAANQPVVSFLTWAAHEVLPARLIDDFDAKQRLLDAVFSAHALPMVVTVVVAAPLGEELFFRGFALPALQRSWGAAAAVIVSGALFSTLHMDPVGFVGLMEIGILLAALRLWSGSLWASVIGHAVNNGIAGGAFLLGFEDPEVPPPAWVLALGATLLIAGIVLLARVLRAAPSQIAFEERVPRRMKAAGALALIWVAAVLAGLSAFSRFA